MITYSKILKASKHLEDTKKTTEFSNLCYKNVFISKMHNAFREIVIPNQQGSNPFWNINIHNYACYGSTQKVQI